MLEYLPQGMTAMRKLSHLYLLNCDSLKRMPPNLSLLHNLCTLTKFVVGTEDGCGIEEIKDLRLQQLSCKLELCKLKNVHSGSKANLHEKRITKMLLDWGHNSSFDTLEYTPDENNSRRSDILTNDEANNEAEILESLPRELEFLEVRGYHGLAISQWMRDPQIF
jgi:hypothetical protein